jgi:dihydrofolate reductase
MSKLRVQCFGISMDGYGAGPNQSLQNPLGEHFFEVMEWFFPTQFWRRMQGQDGGETGVDNTMAAKGFENVGAWILGRNMFGPVRGPWARRHVEGLVGRRAAVSRPPCTCSPIIRARRSR